MSERKLAARFAAELADASLLPSKTDTNIESSVLNEVNSLLALNYSVNSRLEFLGAMQPSVTIKFTLAQHFVSIGDIEAARNAIVFATEDDSLTEQDKQFLLEEFCGSLRKRIEESFKAEELLKSLKQ
jgi:hypothetical protein